MKTFSASRLSEGNKTFPVQIMIYNKGVSVKHPGMFGGNEETIPFNMISKVDVDTPMVGYSNIVIHATNHGEISAHGFTKSEVTEMKKMIFERM